MEYLNNAAQYWEEVESTATSIAEEAISDYCGDGDRDKAEEAIHDYLLHEVIDGHQWIIYTAYHRPIIDYSDSADAYLDIYSHEDLGRIMAEQGLEQVELIRAFWAFYQDVADNIPEALDSIENE